MYIPEDLLFKSGQLARVWLAANQHKKLTKAQVLQDKIDEDIEVIMRPDEHAGGPFALRLNGQLLFGVVRIYSRKARYLLDDCNDALWKIKMAFRPGNIDLPAQTHVANPMSLTLPDVITDLDLLAPMPDPELLFSQNHLDLNLALDDTTVPDWDNSQFLSGSIEQPRGELILDDDDLNLDMGDDLGPPPLEFDEGTSIEVGREAPLERRASEEFGTEMKDDLIEDDLNLDMGDDMTDLPGLGPELDLGDDTDIVMGGTELELPPIEPSVVDEAAPHRGESPLSDIANEELDQLQHTVEGNTAFEPETEQPEEEEESTRQARQKRRKLIAQDTDTTISSSQLREQQANRDKILKPATFLPRDPLLMALINMQRSGGFVSSILGDGRSQGWAPELRGILSLEVVSRPSQKRKRDSGVADLGTEEDEGGTEKTPQLEFDQDEPSLGADIGIGGDTTLGGDSEIIQLPDDGVQQIYDDEDEGFTTLPDNFDDTVAPLVHPAESGPISIGTKHAVQFLRERFGAEAEHSESERQKNSVVFQEMFPESRTTKAEATKMFFEMLVLATKDAIKVEQPINELGGPIRVRAKRGLWGAWAETSASGELASQSEPAPEAPAPEIPAEVSVQA